MNNIPFTPYNAPSGTTFGYTEKPESFYYDPQLYNYSVSPEGKITGTLTQSVLDARARAGMSTGGRYPYRAGTPSYSRPAATPEPDKPAPQLIPSERRAIAESAVLRGFSPLSRQAAPRIASKIESDTERQMLEQQEDRIRDSIISEMLSRYLNPSRRYDQQAEENFARQLDMLARMYGGGVA
jgi:hypothetical protein